MEQTRISCVSVTWLTADLWLAIGITVNCMDVLRSNERTVATIGWFWRGKRTNLTCLFSPGLGQTSMFATCGRRADGSSWCSSRSSHRGGGRNHGNWVYLAFTAAICAAVDARYGLRPR